MFVIYSNVKWQDGAKYGREIYIEQLPEDPHILLLNCHAEERYEVEGLSVTFDLTLYSPSLHMSYTFADYKTLTKGEIIDNHTEAYFPTKPILY